MTPVEWLLFSDFAVVLGMVAAYLPSAIISIVLAFARIEHSVIRASQDLGAGFRTMFSTIVLPLVMPGIVAGFLFVFVVAVGTSMEMQLLGGAGASSVSIIITDVLRVVNFPLAFAIATVVVYSAYSAHHHRKSRAQAVAPARKPRHRNFDVIGLTIMYAPVLYLFLASLRPDVQLGLVSTEPF